MMLKYQILRNSFTWLVFLVMVLCAGVLNVSAQESEPEEDSLEEGATARIGFQYFNLMEEQRLVAAVKSKIEGSYQNISGIKVNFYKGEAVKENLLASRTTNEKGKAILVMPAIDENNSMAGFTYIATIEGDPVYEDNEEEILVKRSVIHLELEEEDSSRWVKVFIGSPDPESGEILPVPDIEVKILVQRLFGLLPLMEDAEVTDEEGHVTMEFPGDIPGDNEGNLVIVAKVEDHEEFGNLEIREKIAWGVPVAKESDVISRELWSARSNAPLSLVFIVNGVVIGVWVVLIYIIVQMYQIGKIGKRQVVK